MSARVQVFDPPMCCSTGMCGPSVDPELVRFAADLQWLAGQDVAVERYNLAHEPAAFAENALVLAALNGVGTEGLPIVLVDGAALDGVGYPTRDRLIEALGLPTGA